jgi:hypothetical protein
MLIPISEKHLATSTYIMCVMAKLNGSPNTLEPACHSLNTIILSMFDELVVRSLSDYTQLD